MFIKSTLFALSILVSSLFAQGPQIPANLDSITVVKPCLTIDSLSLKLKKKPKGLAERAAAMALDSAHCVAPYFNFIGHKTKPAKKYRADVLIRQPQALLASLGIGALSLAEKQHIFNIENLDSLTCTLILDSTNFDSLTQKQWTKENSSWGISEFPCRDQVLPKVLPLIDSLITEPILRKTKWMHFAPEIWYERYGAEATPDELLRYVTHPFLKDSSHCSGADQASPDVLARLGTPKNACYNHIYERFGDAVLRLNFRYEFKPKVLTKIEQRLMSVNTETLPSIQGLIDTLEILLADGESWDGMDSLEVILTRFLNKSPQALRMLKDPNVVQMLAAFQGDLNLLCAYPNINDRMVTKLLQDRYYAELPMPDAQQVENLCSCLETSLCTAVRKVMDQVNSQ